MKIIKNKKVLQEIVRGWLFDRGSILDEEEKFVIDEYLDEDLGFNGHKLTPGGLLTACKLFGWGNVAVEIDENRSGTDTVYIHVEKMPAIKDFTWMPFSDFDEFGLALKEDGRVWFRFWWD